MIQMTRCLLDAHVRSARPTNHLCLGKSGLYRPISTLQMAISRNYMNQKISLPLVFLCYLQRSQIRLSLVSLLVPMDYDQQTLYVGRTCCICGFGCLHLERFFRIRCNWTRQTTLQTRVVPLQMRVLHPLVHSFSHIHQCSQEVKLQSRLFCLRGIMASQKACKQMTRTCQNPTTPLKVGL